MAAGTIRRAPLHLLFNTWIGLVHHYLIHKDLFVSRGSVLHKHRGELADFFVSLLTNGDIKYGQ